MKRVALLTGVTTLIGVLICALFGQWSPRRFSNIQFILGGLLMFVGFLDVMNTKYRIANYTFQLSRSAGQASLEQRTLNDFQELHKSYSGLVIFAVSGLLTMGIGAGMYQVIG